MASAATTSLRSSSEATIDRMGGIQQIWLTTAKYVGENTRLADHPSAAQAWCRDRVHEPPTGTDPAAQVMRQILGIFDEYTSKENGKQVTRATRENAA